VRGFNVGSYPKAGRDQLAYRGQYGLLTS
jgi:hypothetical protein